MSSPLIEIVSATRLSADDFALSALGQSLARLHDERIVPRIAFENRAGLPEVYNTAIHQPGGADLLVFMHDDVWIDESQFGDRIIEGLDRFDVIGVAGNRQCAPAQTSWLLIHGHWDKPENLSGRVAHGQDAQGEVSDFGPVPAPCCLLDGVLLAASKSTLIAAGVQFDPQFSFHFYDMDFCRRATQQALSLGTWPIALTHQSVGEFTGATWEEARRRYLARWD